MKRYKWNIVIILITIVGLSVMLYPNFSNYWNKKNQSQAVASYKEEISSTQTKKYEEMWEEAETYNATLREISSPFRNFDLVENYEDILDVSGTGIMGYITIEEIDVECPIYHGTSEGVLQIAVGHMQGSSLPTGGPGNHVVLSAHNGLSDSQLFTKLDQLKLGDTFSIDVLDRTLIYQVDQILVVEPDDFSEIMIDPEQDYCTLITCTPFGINSHRLLVRGVRVEDVENPALMLEDARQISTDRVAIILFVFLLLIVSLFSLLYRLIKRREKRTKKKKLKKGRSKKSK